MDNKRFFELRRTLNRLAGEILNRKGPAYAGVDVDGEEDRFTNFKVIAELLGLYNVDSAEPLGTWAVYFLKHVLAILSYIGNGVTSEGSIIGNFADARNYLDLGYGMSVEREEEEDEEEAGCCEAVDQVDLLDCCPDPEPDDDTRGNEKYGASFHETLGAKTPPRFGTPVPEMPLEALVQLFNAVRAALNARLAKLEA